MRSFKCPNESISRLIIKICINHLNRQKFSRGSSSCPSNYRATSLPTTTPSFLVIPSRVWLVYLLSYKLLRFHLHMSMNFLNLPRSAIQIICNWLDLNHCRKRDRLISHSEVFNINFHDQMFWKRFSNTWKHLIAERKSNEHKHLTLNKSAEKSSWISLGSFPFWISISLI